LSRGETLPQPAASLTRRARAIAWLVLDVDGVLTDGRLWFTESGETLKAFDVRDGLGIQLLAAGGVEVAVLSSRASEIVRRRAEEIGIREIVQGAADKGAAFDALLARRGLAAREVAYVGDDLLDLPVFARCGLSFAPADAVADVRRRADVRLAARGGRGAVREAAERLLRARGSWSGIVARFGAAR